MKRFLVFFAALAYLFLYAPLAVLAVFSFNSSKLSVWQGFTLHWYSSVFQNSALAEGAVNSFIIASVATIVATTFGTLAAYALWKRRGVSLLVLFQWIFHFLHLHLGMPTVILAHISFSLAYVVIVILARLRSFDTALEEAALDLGANEWQVFSRITVPIIMPGILAAALLCFTVSFDDYVITSLVAGVNSETLPMIIYGLARKGVSPDINALSMLITCGLGFFILLAGRLEQKTQ